MNEQVSPLPAAVDVATYQQEGHWLSPRALDDVEIAHAVEGMRRQQEGDVDPELPFASYTQGWGWRPSKGNTLRRNNFASLRVRELAAIVRHRLLGEMAAMLSGASSIRLWHDVSIYKPSVDRDESADGTIDVTWHTDRWFWRSCSSDRMLTAWIALDDVTEDHGPLLFVPGSHHWPPEKWESYQNMDFLSARRQLEKDGHQIHTQTMKAGQISFHHCRLLHGSGRNTSGRPRRSLAVHLQPGDNRWVEDHDAEGKVFSHVADEYAARRDGVPCYDDARVFPQLWPDER
ncbi:phytanoyl-CoA dioxygenase family protein [Kribbella sp. NPDC058245]|uniref:phytanoyl-CoA dioxygenase family protein n=1 Tax=Kribbella sp. NPDC058245 TaxID=3346399 RepID=UPI0036E11843